jgi:hypothetical protein
MIVTWPRELVQDLARRRCVLFLGSGISRQAQNAAGQRPKMWQGFLEAAVSQVPGSKALKSRIRTLLRERDYLTACEVIKREMGNHAFNAFVRSEFLEPQFVPAPIHDSIISLDARITATPNFDKLYESRINHVQNASVATKLYYEEDIADILRTSGRVIIKIHGTIDKPSDMIFSRIDYSRARSRFHSFYAILEALAITHTFLFLGCGLDDPDIRLVLEDYAFQHSFGHPHYFVLPKRKGDVMIQETIEDGLNVRILRYDPQGDHRLLKDAIDELVVQVTAERQMLAVTQQW